MGAYDYTPNQWYLLKMNKNGIWVNGVQIDSWDYTKPETGAVIFKIVFEAK